MLEDDAAAAAAGQPAGIQRRNLPVHQARWARWVLAIVALAALAATVPTLPVTWENFTNLPTADAGSGGHVTVTGCSRRWLPDEWECRGNFAYTDPMANGPGVTPDVVLANDPHYYHPGAQVPLSNQVVLNLLPGTHRAYVYGGDYTLSTLQLLLGMALCVVAAVVALASRDPRLWGTTVLVVIGAACVADGVRVFWP